MQKAITAIRILIYIVSTGILWAALVVGLQYDPTLANLLIVAGLALAALNTVWIVRSRKKKQGENQEK